MGKQIIVMAVLAADGTLDTEATDKEYFKLRDTLAAQLQEDQNSVAVEMTAFLLQNPGLRTIPTAALVRSLWDAKIESGALKGKSHEERNALFTRLEEIVPEYVKANPDMFHVGRKSGIAIRYVPGEYVTDPKTGKQVFDDEGNPVQAYRHSDEEWAKLTAVKEKKDSEKGNGKGESADAAAA